MKVTEPGAPPQPSVTVVLAGEMDLGTRDEVLGAILRAVEDRPRSVTVDLSGVSFMDCSGLGVLIRAKELVAAAGCQLVVSAFPEPVERLLALTGTLEALTRP
jgi:anti-anti-sigma factor